MIYYPVMISNFFLSVCSCYKAFYSVQCSFPKWAKVLPTIKSVQKVQYTLDRHLKERFPIRMEVGRETGLFKYGPYTEYMLEKFGLLDLINDPNTIVPVKVAVTFDGGSVSHFLGHVMGSYKVVDKRAKHPLTKEPLFGESGSDNMQSHVHCFPIKIALAKDTKDCTRWSFRTFFIFCVRTSKKRGFGSNLLSHRICLPSGKRQVEEAPLKLKPSRAIAVQLFIFFMENKYSYWKFYEYEANHLSLSIPDAQ
jgi:hypothetical protein